MESPDFSAIGRGASVAAGIIAQTPGNPEAEGALRGSEMGLNAYHKRVTIQGQELENAARSQDMALKQKMLDLAKIFGGDNEAANMVRDSTGRRIATDQNKRDAVKGAQTAKELGLDGSDGAPVALAQPLPYIFPPGTTMAQIEAGIQAASGVERKPRSNEMGPPEPVRRPAVSVVGAVRSATGTPRRQMSLRPGTVTPPASVGALAQSARVGVAGPAEANRRLFTAPKVQWKGLK